MIRFSIIIPHKDIPELLLRCLDSIPKRDDLEVIVVDDNSNPDVVDFDNFPGQGRSDVKVIYTKEGKGAGYVRNVGLRHAQGEWVLFPDADDYFTHLISKILDACNHEYQEYDAVYFDSLSLDNETCSLTPRCNQINRIIELWNENKDEGEKYLRFLFGEPWCKIVKMELIRKHGICFEETPIHNDTFFSYSIGLSAREITVDSRIAYVVSQRNGSLSTTLSDEKVLARISVFARKYITLKKHGHEILEQFIPETLNELKSNNNKELYDKCIEKLKEYNLDESILSKEITVVPRVGEKQWMYIHAYEYIEFIKYIDYFKTNESLNKVFYDKSSPLVRFKSAKAIFDSLMENSLNCMDKILSIIVPTYNMEAYLDKCLSSLIIEDKDLLDLLEVIVVNDGSKDKSSEIAHRYQNKYPNVFRVIDKENGNYGTCVNRGIEEAKGKYVRTLDADDYFETRSLHLLLYNLQKLDTDLVITESQDRDPQGNLRFHMKIPTHIKKGEKLDAKCFDSLKEGFPFLFCSHLLIYRTELLRNIGLKLQAGISYTDNEYVFFPLDRIQTLVFFELPLYQYLIGRDGQTTQPDIMYRNSWQIIQVFNRLFDHYLENKANNPIAVQNNQRLVLAEMSRWVYGPLFQKPYTEEKKQKLMEIEAILLKDKELYNMLDNYYTNNNQWLKLYRTKGIYINDWRALRVHFTIAMWKLRATMGVKTRLKNWRHGFTISNV